MNHTVTLELRAKGEFKVKLRQFKSLIDFNKETHVLNVTGQGKIINRDNGVYHLSGESLEIGSKKITIPTLGNLTLDKIKTKLYVTFYTYEK